MKISSKRLRIFAMIFGIICSLLFFEEIVDDVFFDPKEGDTESIVFDRSVGELILNYHSPRLTQVMIDLTALGSFSVIGTLFFILASILIVYRDLKGLLYLSIVFIGGGVWPLLLKSYFGRARPITEHLVQVSDLSFPSGHAFGATAAYIALAVYAAQYAKTIWHEFFFYSLGVLIVLIVGCSRVYLGVHFPTDVLGGMSAGLAWVMSVTLIFRLLRRHSV